jgi:cytidylate kinase
MMTANQPLRIAIDGPSGAGKSTIAKRLAVELGIDYIDTGAMYRAIALKIQQTETDFENDEAGLSAMLSRTTVDFDKGRTLLDGEDVSLLIRTPEITELASKSSAYSIIREKLVALQRKMGEEKPVIMDGRDIGTNVFPNAEFKFYMTASAEERAKRRFKELIVKEPDTKYEDVLAAIVERDKNDSERELNPLKMADDATLIETDKLGVEEVTRLLKDKVTI